MMGDGTEHDGTLGETADEPLAEHEIVANDEPSMEDYPPVDDFGAPIKAPVPIHEGVRDTQNR